MSERPEAERDAVARHVEGELFAFLVGTARTARDTDDMVDLATGAQAAVARFIWAARNPLHTPETCADAIRANFLSLFTQLADGERESAQ